MQDDWGRKGETHHKKKNKRTWVNPSEWYSKEDSYTWDYGHNWDRTWKGDTWKHLSNFASHESTQILDMSANERLLFLSRIWSGDSLVRISRIDYIPDKSEYHSYLVDKRDTPNPEYMSTAYKPCSNLRTRTIFLPSLSGITKTMGGHEGIKDEPYGVWRILRYLNWHESMHLLHTDPRFDSALDNYSIDKEVYNAIEDGRVNKLGTVDYPGMISEDRFFNKATDTLLEMISDRLDKIVPDPPAMIIHALCARMTDSSIAPYLPYLEKDDTDLIHDVYSQMITAIEEGEPGEVTSKLSYTLAKKVTNYLEAKFPKYEYKSHTNNAGKGAGSDAIKNHDPTDLQSILSFVDGVRGVKRPDEMTYDSPASMRARAALAALTSKLTSDSMSSKLEPLRLDAMTSCPEHIKSEVQEMWEEEKEAQQFQSILSNTPGITGRGAYGFGKQTFDSYVDRDMVMRMVSNLRKWKDKHLETLGEAGADIDVEKMIIDDIKHSPVDEFYLTTEAMNPRDNILIVLDTSGSMDGKQIEDAKKSLATLSVALEMLRTNYSIWLMNSSFDSDKGYLQQLKSFDNRRLKPVGKKIIAKLSGHGGTPMSRAMDYIMKQNDFKKCGYFILTTDGDVGDISDEAKKLRESGKPHQYLYLNANRSLGIFKRYIGEGIIKKNEITATPINELPTLIINMILRKRVVD